MKLTYETAETRLQTSTCTRMQFIGQRCEGAVMSALLKAGKRVLIPYSDARYDLVVEQDGEFIRIQCKAGRLAPNHRAIQFCTTSLNTVQGKHVKQNYRGQVEFFGVYCGEIDKVYLVPVEDVGTDNATLHLSKPRSRSTEDVRLAATYEFSPPNPKFELDPYQYPVYRDPATSYNLRIERSKWVLRWRVGAYGPEQVRKSLDVGLVSKYPTRQEILAAMGWEPSERLSAQIRPATRRKKLPISRTVKARKLKTPEAKSGKSPIPTYPKNWSSLPLSQRQNFIKARWQPEQTPKKPRSFSGFRELNLTE